MDKIGEGLSSALGGLGLGDEGEGEDEDEDAEGEEKEEGEGEEEGDPLSSLVNAAGDAAGKVA